MDARPRHDRAVRKACAADTTAIGRIAQSVGLFPSEMLPDMMAGCIERASADLWLVALVGGTLAGFAFCEPERLTAGTWNLRAIGVDEAFQAQGVGSALLAALGDELRGSDQRLLLVETMATPAYAGARRCYERAGFARDGRIRDFYDEGLDKVVFARSVGRSAAR